MSQIMGDPDTDPELYMSLEHLPIDITYNEALIGISSWIVELDFIDILVEVLLISSHF